MLASSFGDLIIGLDLHFELVPTPVPAPAPIPNPFFGMVWDPASVVVGAAINGLISAATGAPFKGPVLLWGAFPATNTGTEGKGIPPHFLLPPGVSWAPFPKVPFPIPGSDPPGTPGNPMKPENDAIVVTGSKTVSVMGSSFARLGDLAMSCSEPVRLPSSTIIAIPKGAPVTVGGPMSLDLMSAVMASMRTRFVSDALHGLISRMSPGRLRNFLHRAACFLTGHPVDVATGRVITDAVDFALPGPLPLKFERVYSSGFASRRGPLGYGWSHSLNQEIWEERGKVVYLTEDGREIEFDTLSLPNHRLDIGDHTFDPINRLTLFRDGPQHWRIVNAGGMAHAFQPTQGRSGVSVLHSIHSSDGHHSIRLRYDERGNITHCRDCSGRTVLFVHDDENRLVRIELPQPVGSGNYVHRRYGYDLNGDLAKVGDALGGEWSFEYADHLLVRETDRLGFSFYFAYDGQEESSHCTRTWGDTGVYDHLLRYDRSNRVTFVTNAHGNTTTYKQNQLGLVTEIIDPLGGVTRFDYDPIDAALIRTMDPLGRVTEFSRSIDGEWFESKYPSGRFLRMERDPAHYRFRTMDSNGVIDESTLSQSRRAIRNVDASGVASDLSFDKGMIRQYGVGSATTRFEYSESLDLRRVYHPTGGQTDFVNDNLGRMVLARNPLGGELLRKFDSEGRLVTQTTPTGTTERFEYDQEGNLVLVSDGCRSVAFKYGPNRRLVERTEGTHRERLEYDSEGTLTAVVNGAGERYELTYDAAGRLVGECSFDGINTTYIRDRAGQIITRKIGSTCVTHFVYDADGNPLRIENEDGTFAAFTYDVSGAIVSATNAETEVRYERDPAGRITAEHQLLQNQNKVSVRVTYDTNGRRSAIASSLGASLRLRHDAAGGIVGARADHYDHEISIERDAFGFEKRVSLPGGVTIAWERNRAGRPVTRTVAAGGMGRDEGERTTSYDWGGELRIDRIRKSHSADVTYARDSRGTTMVETRRDTMITRAADSAGNVYRTLEGTDRSYLPGGRIDRTTTKRFIHDEIGRIAQTVRENGEVWKYEWDDFHMLRRASRADGLTVEFVYDAFGRRMLKRSTSTHEESTRFVWDGDVVLHEVSTEMGLTTWYSDPRSLAPMMKERTGKIWSIGVDHIGTPSELYDDQGKLCFSLELDIWGTPTTTFGSLSDCPWRWPGQYADVETGWYYNRFRYYSPELGRYTSRDPLGLLAGLNPFSYVVDPTWAIDFWGLSECLPEPRHPLLVDNSFLVRALNGDETAQAILREARGNSFIDFSQLNEFFNVRRADRLARERFLRQSGVQALDPLFSSRLLQSAEGQEVFRRLLGACERPDATMAAIARAGGYNVVTADGRLARTVGETFANQARNWGLRISLLSG